MLRSVENKKKNALENINLSRHAAEVLLLTWRSRWIFDVRWNMKFAGCTLFRKLNIMPRFRAQVASFSKATCDWRFDISLRLHLSFLFIRIVSKTHDVSQFHARFNWFSLRYAGLRFFKKYNNSGTLSSIRALVSC